MRGNIEAGSNPGGAQSSLDHGASGTFAVRSGDVNPAAGAMRIAKTLEQRTDPIESQLGG